MTTFKSALEKKLVISQFNNFGIDNYDEYRFGNFPTINVQESSAVFRIKNFIKKVIRYKNSQIQDTQIELLLKYGESLQSIYEKLSANDRSLIIDIIAYRLLGYKKVKLPRNNKKYWDSIDTANSLADISDVYDPHFLHFILFKHDLKKIGYDIQLYFSGAGIAIDFILEQYAYKIRNKTIVSAEKGDTVLDIGACWGDTALYFASKVGKIGKVYSFEFIPDNVKLFNINISINPDLKEQIELVQHPVSNQTGNVVFYVDNGPGSRIEFEPFEGKTGQITTISIDDFIENSGITNVDFIKMDIEGAEIVALEGAVNTIKKFKPKLAIAIYHNMDDFVNIPSWIVGLNLNYQLFLDHFTIHAEETVIFAKVKND
jgi:FkbM family methyltransferase